MNHLAERRNTLVGANDGRQRVARRQLTNNDYSTESLIFEIAERTTGVVEANTDLDPIQARIIGYAFIDEALRELRNGVSIQGSAVLAASAAGVPVDIESIATERNIIVPVEVKGVDKRRIGE